MLRNYLAAALRNLQRNRLYAAINIVGLAIGFAAALMIGLFVRHELTFDTFIPGHESIYRVSMAVTLPGAGSNATEDVRGWIPYQMKLDFPQIAALARLSNNSGAGASLRRGDIEANEERFYWADPNIFDVLPLPAFAGDLKTALQRPDGLVLTRRMARKYFGRDNPIGESIEVNREQTMQVTAVLEDLPSNTHLNAEVLASAVSKGGPQGVFSSRVYAYLRLAPGTTAAQMREALRDFIDRHSPRPPAGGKASDTFSLPLLSIGEIHLHPAGAFAMTPGGDLRTIRAIAAVGGLILLLASINFVNLMTARAARRAVEVGVRKVCGGGRRDLVLQFMGESLMYAALAMLFAMVLVELLLPGLNGFLDRNIGFDYGHAPLLGAIVALVLVTGALAGIYPALVLSAFAPASVLKGGAPQAAGSGRVRQLLVLLQFAILTGLILVTAIIYRQTAFGLRQGLRFDKDQLLAIATPPAACEKSTFRTAVENLPGVRGTACSMVFLNDFGTDQYLAPDGREVTLQSSLVGAGLFELIGLAPVAGRFFVRDREADALPPLRFISKEVAYPVVINETAVRQLGFKTPQEAIGQRISSRTSGERREIMGVVPDFSRDTVRQSIEAMFYENSAGWFMQLNVKLRGSAVAETLAAIDRLWARQPGQTGPIARHFYDQYVQNLYSGLIRQSAIFTGFAAVALFLAGLGLFGLAGFTVERRTREIGIRKAMGAETGDITRLLLWQFARPVLLANLIAWPIVGFVMNRWLQGFAYHIDLEWWLFAAASTLALLIALLTVSGHSVVVARAKPVTALRYE
jgi:putative ABC transport system permease protein